MPKKKEVKEEKTVKNAETAIIKFRKVTVKLTAIDKDVKMEVL